MNVPFSNRSRSSSYSSVNFWSARDTTSDMLPFFELSLEPWLRPVADFLISFWKTGLGVCELIDVTNSGNRV
jgi:hypothetical protein